MLNLSNAALLEVYERAEEVRVDQAFIELLEEEMKRRGI
ncbi:MULTISPECIES: sporulation histidine kinase inhibitor Sda [unclassified Sporosarcina]|nr:MULTISPECIES: sporulation histidine kinase inhibitor Sda [unclassified Sporosarcina]PIC71257.1 sporulation histidine kinase inhibitor Sda [Sporosarcina sp. P16b]PID14622.1 sporulation histidine kinase inhibitor Sda [Sporosarcina sp. P34]PID25440.1 sporulation histidine kinase inhibitor Sda [Sporosarcina sp. P7]